MRPFPPQATKVWSPAAPALGRPAWTGRGEIGAGADQPAAPCTAARTCVSPGTVPVYRWASHTATGAPPAGRATTGPNTPLPGPIGASSTVPAVSAALQPAPASASATRSRFGFPGAVAP